MIVTVFDFFQIHWKVIPRYAPIVVQNVFSITPKSFNAVDMVFGLFIHKIFGMIHHQMFSITLQRLISAKCIGEIYRSLAGICLDVGHQRLCRDRLDDLGVHPAISLQQAEYNAFASRSTATLSPADTTEIGLVQFDLVGQFGTFQFCGMKQRNAQPLIDPGDRFGVQAQITGQSIGRLLLVKPLQDRDLSTQLGQALLLAARQALYVTSCGLHSLEKAAKNTLATIQKVVALKTV